MKILYGAGQIGESVFNALGGDDIFAFADINKAGTEYLGKPVIHPEKLTSLYKENEIIICVEKYAKVVDYLKNIGVLDFKIYYDISIKAAENQIEALQKQLHQQTEAYEKLILSLNPLLDELIEKRGGEYYSCRWIEEGVLHFTGGEYSNNIIGMCATGTMLPPETIIWKETTEQTLKCFQKKRAVIIAENKINTLLLQNNSSVKNRFRPKCTICKQVRLNKWDDKNSIIKNILLGGIINSHCQCKCIYCPTANSFNMKVCKNQQHDEDYSKIFELINYGQNNGVIAEDVYYMVGIGEITIHPYKDKFYKFLKGKFCEWSTNCFIYDEKIAENLGENPRSMLRFSIDCGTAETWNKVKGVDNYNAVIKNLVKYVESCVNPGQIELKYIILPGINDNKEDYLGVIKLMKELKINILDIERNFLEKRYYSKDEDMFKKVAEFEVLLIKNGFENKPTNLGLYLPHEREKIVTYVNEILKSGEV